MACVVDHVASSVDSVTVRCELDSPVVDTSVRDDATASALGLRVEQKQADMPMASEAALAVKVELPKSADTPATSRANGSKVRTPAACSVGFGDVTVVEINSGRDVEVKSRQDEVVGININPDGIVGINHGRDEVDVELFGYWV